jgi:hypothetical protein
VIAYSVDWRLTDQALVESRAGRRERLWPLNSLRRVHISPGANRYLPDETVLRLVFRRGALNIGSHSFRGLARYEDQTRAFTAWVRAVCAEAASAAPGARFESGAMAMAGVFTGAMVLLGIGVAALLLVSITTGASGLGLDLAARLSFGLMLMIAVQPWIAGRGLKQFDPCAIPASVLAGGRP